jgi:hypothetical protein
MMINRVTRLKDDVYRNSDGEILEACELTGLRETSIPLMRSLTSNKAAASTVNA